MPAETVQVWLIGSRLPAHVLAGLETVLDDEERGRADALRCRRHRRRFIAAHGAARTILGRRLGIAPEGITWLRGAHGKPELTGAAAGLQVNLSHSGDLAVLAVAAGRKLGVDIQQLRPTLDAVSMSARYFTDQETSFVAAAPAPATRVARFTRLWARKEACVKASGGRLMQGMMLPVHAGTPDGVVVRGLAGALPGPYLVRDLATPGGYRASVALEGTEQYRVIQAWWRD